MNAVRCCVLLSVLASLILSMGTPSSAQNGRRDLSSGPVKARDAIEQLAGSLEKSVVCDIDLPAITVVLGPTAKTPERALAQLLSYKRYFTVDVAGVVIVAGDDAKTRANYQPERVAACRLAIDDGQKRYILFHATPVETVLTQLAAALGQRAVFEPKAANGSRSFNITLFDATAADAIGIVCLATHYQVHGAGDEMVFSEYVATPTPAQGTAPPN